MPIRKSEYYQDARNMEFTSQQFALGQKLAEILASVGNDLDAAAPLVEKAGFSQDRAGFWFAKAGTHKITLEADATGIGAAGQVVTVPEMVMVPTPAVLLPEKRARGRVPMVTLDTTA
jgi:hypothetical protein